jgi:predicted dehydrogenase
VTLAMPPLRFVVVDPGHFHAALVQKEMYAQVSPQAHVYAPLGSDLLDYLSRIARFNSRTDDPTSWQIEIHAGPDFLERMRHERAGDVAIFSGRNRGKIERIQTAIEAGMHVLADKPVIIRREDLPALEGALSAAEGQRLVVQDLMTGRGDVVAELLRGLRCDPAVFGEPVEVAVVSIHHIMKEVAGVPNLRPAWYFDIDEQGEGIADIGTHLVDRVHGVLFPSEALDYRRDIGFESASRWPTMLTPAQFRQVTGEAAWPEFLHPWLRAGELECFCNMRARYTVRGVVVSLETRWDWQAPPGGDDMHTAVYSGSRGRLEIRQGEEQGFRPELYVIPEADIAASLERRIAELRQVHPGIATVREGEEWRIEIPTALRLGHDPRFAQFTRRFLDLVREPGRLPSWEKSNMLAKYYVCTEAVALARG